LLKQIEPATGKNNQYSKVKGDADASFHSRSGAAREVGMSERQQVTAVPVANVPAEEFERQVESAKPPTISQLAQQGIKRPSPKPIVDLKGRDPSARYVLARVTEFDDDSGDSPPPCQDSNISATTNYPRTDTGVTFASLDTTGQVGKSLAGERLRNPLRAK